MPFITATNAKELSAKAHEARRLLAAKDLPEDPYIRRELARVREQIAKFSAMLEGEPPTFKDGRPNWAAYKAIADAKCKLRDEEAALAMRPAPGQLRPTAQRSAPRPVGGLAPRAAEPAPESQNGPSAPPST